MSALADRWPALGALPRVHLTDTPTPVTRLHALSDERDAELWAKRDDRTSALYGGNKARKLELLLGEARERGARSIVTLGALGSHHALSTSLHGAREGFDVHVVLGPQPFTAHVEEILRAQVASGATIHRARTQADALVRAAAIHARLRLAGRRPFLIPHGGSSVTGSIAYVEAGYELAVQIDEGRLPEPSSLYVPHGSGGTVAGIAVGLAAAGLPCSVRAVRVVDRAVANRAALRLLVRGVVDRLRGLDDRFPDVADVAMGHIEIDGSQLGRGYGHATEATTSATAEASRDRLTLEPTYTAKAFAAFVAGAHRGTRALFWHTLSAVAPPAFAPSIPRWAERYRTAASASGT